MEEYENRSAGRSETWGEDESRVFVEYGRAMVPGREEIERTILDLIPAEPDEPFLGVEIGTGAGRLSAAVPREGAGPRGARAHHPGPNPRRPRRAVPGGGDRHRRRVVERGGAARVLEGSEPGLGRLAGDAGDGGKVADALRGARGAAPVPLGGTLLDGRTAAGAGLPEVLGPAPP